MFGLVLGTTEDQVAEDLAAVLAWLPSDPAARGGAMGCIGYCIGARSVLCTLRDRGDQFRAGVGLHPSFCTTEDTDSPHLGGAVLHRIVLHRVRLGRHDAAGICQHPAHRGDQRLGQGRGRDPRRRRPRVRRVRPRATTKPRRRGPTSAPRSCSTASSRADEHRPGHDDRRRRQRRWSMTSLLCVTGSRLPPSSSRDPVAVSITSEDPHVDPLVNLDSDMGAVQAEQEPGVQPPAVAGESVDGRVRHTNDDRRRKSRLGVGGTSAGERPDGQADGIPPTSSPTRPPTNAEPLWPRGANSPTAMMRSVVPSSSSAPWTSSVICSSDTTAYHTCPREAQPPARKERGGGPHLAGAGPVLVLGVAVSWGLVGTGALCRWRGRRRRSRRRGRRRALG